VAWNPYLEEWAAANGVGVPGWQDEPDNQRQLRQHLTHKYAFGVPGDAALDCLGRYGPLVEIGAGTGYWARCLRERGVDIVAYDVMGDSWRSWFRPSILAETHRDGTRAIEARPYAERAEPVLWTEVLQGGPEVLGGYVERTLLICWPDPWSGFDEVSLLAYPGGRVAVVGEPGEAGPGSPGFRALLQRSWQQIEIAPVPRWPDSQDRLVIYSRP
jgi:hypothetical protein